MRSLRTSLDVFLPLSGKAQDSFISTDAELKPSQLTKQHFKNDEPTYWIPQWSSMLQISQFLSYCQINSFCPFCGKYISTSSLQNILSCFFKNNTRAYLSHLNCLEKSNFTLSQKLDDLIEPTVYEQSLVKQHRLLILGEKQYYVEIQIVHPLSSFTYFKGFKKLIYNGIGILWDFNQQSKQNDSFLLSPNMICIPINEMKIILSIIDMSKKEQIKQQIKILANLNDSVKNKDSVQSHQKSFQVTKGTSIIKLEFSIFKQQFQKSKLIDSLNYKYKFPIDIPENIVRLNKLDIQIKNLSVSSQQSIMEEIKNEQEDELDALFSPVQISSNSPSKNKKFLQFSPSKKENFMKVEKQFIFPKQKNGDFQNQWKNSAVSQEADLQDEQSDENFQKFQKVMMSSQKIPLNSSFRQQQLKASGSLSSCKQIKLKFGDQSPKKQRINEESTSPTKNKLKHSQFTQFSHISRASAHSIHSMKSSNSSINNHLQNIFCGQARLSSIEKKMNAYNSKGDYSPSHSMNTYSFTPQLNNFAQQIEPQNIINNRQVSRKQLKQYVCSHSGSKQFQKTIQHMKPNEVDSIIQTLYYDFPQLIVHQYANYMFQSLIGVCSLQQRLMIIQSLVGTENKFGELVSTKQGTFSLQQFISYLTQDEQFQALCQAIRKTPGKKTIKHQFAGFLKLSKDINATHFIRKMIKSFPPKLLISFAQFCSSEDNFYGMVIDKNAICVIKAFFSIMNSKKKNQKIKDERAYNKFQQIKRKMITQMSRLLDEIIIDQFGNYIIQQAYDLFEEQELIEISKSIIKGFAFYSGEKFSNNVLFKCVKQYWHSPEIYSLLRQSLNQKDIISMFKNRQGNRILLEIVEKRQFSGLKEKIEDTLLNVESSKFNSNKWISSQRKSKTGTIGTKFTNFSDAVEGNKSKYRQSQNSSYRQKKREGNRQENSSRTMKKSNIVPTKRTSQYQKY